MKNCNLISDYLSGKLFGNIISNTDKKLVISRYYKSGKQETLDNLILLHCTNGFIDNENIGYATTYLDGNLKDWESFQAFRMRDLLNKYGYKTYNYLYDKEKEEISRTIESKMEFGTIFIKEKILLSKINNL